MFHQNYRPQSHARLLLRVYCCSSWNRVMIPRIVTTSSQVWPSSVADLLEQTWKNVAPSIFFSVCNSRKWPLSPSLSFSPHMIYYMSGDLGHISIRNIRPPPPPPPLGAFLPINLMHFPSLGTITVENGRPPRRSAVARKGSRSHR